MRKKTLLISGGLIGLVSLSLFFGFLPSILNPKAPIDFLPERLLPNTAATFSIFEPVGTSFGTYTPLSLEYSPQIEPTLIKSNLANVDFQGVSLTQETKNLLEQFGFALVDEDFEDIYDYYNDESKYYPKFITTDLCLHAYHVIYDITLRILEGEKFFYDFEQMLSALRDSQMALNGSITSPTVIEAINKNVAYLSVMLYLLNDTNIIPAAVESLTNAELTRINESNRAVSPIFGYEEDYTQYKIRGHYTRNDLLGNYFKAMMYAGRISFLLQSPSGDPTMGIEHTRMALLLISSFNSSISSSTVWDYWDRVYEPTVFYVGASDDLTALEYYTIWKNQGFPQGDDLADENTIEDFIEEAKTYRKPKINSMFIYDAYGHENVTQGFRLMGQRFIPDSYIFQQLVHNKVTNRMFPISLDIFSVFGSPRAAEILQPENETYSEYHDQIIKLREEFNSLTEMDWTQNLYWLWLYTLFPLLAPAVEGYPGFMLSNAWTDKALMTTLGSWAELRHDTILYAKQSYTYEVSAPPAMYGYVEPYPEVYARLASLVNLMKTGLDSRGLFLDSFNSKLDQLEEIFNRLAAISIKELENKELTEEDHNFIRYAGQNIGELASFHDPDAEDWVSETDARMAIIADVHTDPNSMRVLEVGTGDPYSIYVIVQDHKGNLRLTRGGTFSYYEFKHPMDSRLSDEEWHTLLDDSPPPIPLWLLSTLPLHQEILDIHLKEQE